MQKQKVILGIDPGTNIMGYGIIKVTGTKSEVITLGVVHLKLYKDHFSKLQHIFERTLELIDGFQPDEVALEAPFFGKNIQSMLKLGRAQGAAIAAALYRKLPVFEYAPLKVKMAITGSGSASKEQVAIMLQRVYKFKDIPEHLDATDGLAVAMCHSLQRNIEDTSGKPKSWAEFIAKNPGKVKK